MMRDVRALLFDLDGTLVDSVPDMADAIDRVLPRLGLPEAGEQQVQNWAGNGAAKLVERALSAQSDTPPTSDQCKVALGLFLEEYRQQLFVRSRVYPGVREGLDRLRADGYRLACVTNKPEAMAADLLGEMGYGPDWFPVVVGGDTLPMKKPDPAPLYHAMGVLAVSASQTLMVGDSVTDVRSARNAGIGVVCVPYGYNHGNDIREAGPDRVVETLVELHRLLREAA